MTDTELKELKALVDTATPGPWTAERDALGHWRIRWCHSRNSSVLRNGKVFSDDDIAFICAARTSLPLLVDEVRRLQAALEEKNLQDSA